MKKPGSSEKSILVIGINFSPELTGIGKYTGEMVDWMIENNYECSVVTSFPYYPYWKVQSPYKNRFYTRETLRKGMLNIYRCPLYVPKQPSGLKRLIHEFSFFFSALIMIIYLLFKPKKDYIFCIAPPFHLGFLGVIYRFFKGGKILYHIQDLQIEAARDLKILKSPKAFKVLFSMEKLIMRKVNFISSISSGMLKKIANKIDKEIIFFPNWVDTTAYCPLYDSAELKILWGFHQDDKVILYSGSIGEKQGLESIINVAKELESSTFIKFVICGTGPYKEKLMLIAKENKLENIFFMPLQQPDMFNNFLNMADVHLILQKKSASDLMMPSKLTTILAVGGLALVTAEPGTNLFEVVNENEMGIVIPSENLTSLKDAIYNCCIRDNSAIKLNGRNYAESYLNKNSILKKLMSQVDNIPSNTEQPKLEFLELK
ncbi:WcaI family glycosyltransferase [Mucilaginibacter sp. SP1R1]|uniref:WcaI family glycosyltransferase n=1 Tax=Mucilaginibacter sp. SP1R1 TaxID=2723091 RepID=UPI001609B951|nr:WcaI family glycosyltransferase [Mucilaginibacter sp. SP1R1]MBB6149054.1 colanic acid biosynthesis glycosyl transferase WcaI [Mucilaginibacter sp. SP1R1]